MVIIETSIFTRLIKELMDDNSYREFQEFLVQQPDAGDLIPGSGGLRKIRWKIEGRGNEVVSGLSITGWRRMINCGCCLAMPKPAKKI